MIKAAIIVFILCLLAGTTVLAFNGSLTLKLGNRMGIGGSSTAQNVVFQAAATTWQGGAVTW